MGQHPQFNLRIIRIHQHTALPGHKHLTDPAAQFHAHGNILQIGLGGTDAPGSRYGLVEIGMDSAPCVNIFRQSVRVSALQLGQSPVFQNILYNGMLRRQLFQHVRSRGIAGLGLFAPWKLHLVKQDLSQLLGGIDVKAASGLLMNALLQFLDPGHQSIPVMLKFLPAHRHALPLHLMKHQGKGHLHLFHKLPHPCLGQLLPDHLPGLQGGIGLILVKYRQLLQIFCGSLRQALFAEALPVTRYG